MIERFYLDNDVDIECVGVLVSAGFKCWSASQAGTQSDQDDEQTVYATDKLAVLITHDRAFTDRRKKMPFGHHVRLCCHQLDAPELLRQSLPKIIAILQASPDMVLEVHPGRNGVAEVDMWFGTEDGVRDFVQEGPTPGA